MVDIILDPLLFIGSIGVGVFLALASYPVNRWLVRLDARGEQQRLDEWTEEPKSPKLRIALESIALFLIALSLGIIATVLGI